MAADTERSVHKVYDEYKSAGIQNIRMKLYEGDRHEILNETDRNVVYEDLLKWMEETGHLA